MTFRTNAANKNAYTLTSSEIALDYDGDGDLDCFKYYSFYNNYFERLPTTLAETPEGYDVNKYGSNKVIINYGSKAIYAPANGACTLPLTTVPTEPYTSNGRETYR